MRITALLLAASIALPAAAAHDDLPRILILVDASASMATSWPGQRGDRMGAVRTTLDVIDAVFLERDVQPEIAVRVYGDQLSPNDTEACNDTRLIRPWAPAVQNQLRRTLETVQPRGAGSLALALDGALSDLVSPRKQDLVLIILDGLNRCDRDLKESFRSLTLDGEGAEVHIFGFGLGVTDQAELSTYARYHSVGSPTQLTQGITTVISLRLSLPLAEDSIGVALSGQGRLNFDLGQGTLDIVGTWNEDPIAVDLSREKPRFRGALGTATVIASESEEGQRQHIVRVPVVPEGQLQLEFFEPSTAELSVQLQESGWGHPGTLQVSWRGAFEQEFQLVLQENGVPGASWIFAQSIVEPEGQITLATPARPMELTLQLRKPVGPGDGIIAAAVFDSPGRNIALDAPVEAEAGGSVTVTWDGESYPGDLVTLVPANAPPEMLENAIDAVGGSPRDFLIPFDQCPYEFRYIDGRSFEVLARSPLEVRAPSVGLMAPSTDSGSQTIDVRWWGPAGSLDVITLTEIDAEGAEYLDWASPTDGSPARLRLPQEPGDYEIRYLTAGRDIEATLPLKVNGVAVSIDVPKTARVGERLRVAWSGPNGPDDFLILVRKGERISRHLDFIFVSEGSPTSMATPRRPGLYEVQYIATRPRKVLLSVAVEVVK